MKAGITRPARCHQDTEISKEADMARVRTFVLITGILANVSVMRADIRVATQVPQLREEVTVLGLRPGSEMDYFLTFGAPVALPGVALSSGTYLFRRVTPGAIQVLSVNRQHAYAMVQTIPISRTKVTNSHEFLLGEAPSPGAPRPIKAWFLPGHETGQELLYPTWQVNRNTTK
jgi:hypothetical protein